MPDVLFTESLYNEKNGEPTAVLVQALSDSFSPGESIAVKLHMGEENNHTALTPQLTKAVITALKSIGTHPFIFDSPVAYRSRRSSPEGYLDLARERGFSPATIGCPVRVSNESLLLKGNKIDYHLCRDLAEVDGVCILSHVKGHPCTGFGGAIKNIGMGAMSIETKSAIHDGGKPVYHCGCTECMKCVEMCPTGNIRLCDAHPEFDRSFCVGCSNCSIVCEEEAIRPEVEFFDRMLAEATALALPHLGNLFFINCLINITELCDCVANSGRTLCKDVGYIIGENLFAIERSSLDLILERAGKDIFFELHHISPSSHIERLQSILGDSGTYNLKTAR